MTVTVAGQEGSTVAFDAAGLAGSISRGLELEVDLIEARSDGWYNGTMLQLVVEQL